MLLKSVPYKFLSTQLVYRVETISVNAENIPSSHEAISRCTKKLPSVMPSIGEGSGVTARAIKKMTKIRLEISKPIINAQFTVLVYFSALKLVQFAFVIALTSYKLRATKRKARDWHHAKQISLFRSKALIICHSFVFQLHMFVQESQSVKTIVVSAKM